MTPDVWDSLACEKRPIVLYGTGNGADRILDRFGEYGIRADAVFASDGFVRKRTFRGFDVESYRSVTKRLGDDIVIVVAFGSSRQDVIRNIIGMSARHTVLVPDLPVAGDEIWCRGFREKYAAEIGSAENLYADEKSRALYRSVVDCRTGGALDSLFENLSTPDDIWSECLRPERYRTAADVGAYNGDTAVELIKRAPRIEKVFAVEPDEKNFSSLCVTAGFYGKIIPYRTAAWDRNEILDFSRDGGRGAGTRGKGNGRTAEVLAKPLDSILDGEGIDYLKIDAEGAESKIITGAAGTLAKFHPDIRVAAYHRPGDIFRLPELIRGLVPGYDFYLRRTLCVPCWDLDIIAVYSGS